MNEEYCNLIYNKILKYIVEPLVGNKTTYMSDLEKVGKKMLGQKFLGVYPSDKIPTLKNHEYAILNLDKSNESGSHWVAIAKIKNKTHFYDSFGRKDINIIKSLKYSGNGKIINTDNDAEQKKEEMNCGARCIAWLILFDKWGSTCADMI